MPTYEVSWKLERTASVETASREAAYAEGMQAVIRGLAEDLGGLTSYGISIKESESQVGPAVTGHTCLPSPLDK